MPRYTTVINSTWDRPRAFAFMSDFSNAEEWDPGVKAARCVAGGPVGIGSAFDLDVVFAGQTMTLRYEVVEIEADRRVVLKASTGRLESIDTLTFDDDAGGTEVTYDALLTFKGVAALANPLLGLGFARVGDRARDSLHRVLTQA
ncbi:MAG TPA: SRPBCC family protein [Candidatus Dormibacteraeota bacterium]|nr:SRPBCC family protein [Candidatus Dormibacteraeota bacterium]